MTLKQIWADNTIAIAHVNHNTNLNGASVPFDVTQAAHVDTDILGQARPIQSTDLDISTATSPFQLTHKISGSIGYISYENKAPLLMSVGASYEIAQNNNALSGYTIWGKFGFNF